MTGRLQGRTALVTGSTDGLGVGIARALADEGAFVIVSGRNADRGEKVVAEIGERGGSATFVRADLAGGAAAARELADAAQAAAGGPLDILVNNAAMLIAPGPTAAIGEDVIDGALAVNVKSVILLTGLIAPGMAARGSGAIVNVGSINGLVGMAQSALYSSTKAAVHSLTKSCAAEYGPSGVRVNTIAPGPTLTERNAAFADRIAPIVERAPSRRMGTTDEVGQAVVFLASDEASNIHGATLSVDGGLSAI
jgi:NAD(P)-dependent dehydrogenase (short-subunit alcohol dehydrogenase family)